MSKLSFYKVTELPAVLKPDAIYYVKSGSTVSAYVTDSNKNPYPVVSTNISPSLVSREFEQNTPSDTWSITHNLGYKPNVFVQDSAGSMCIGIITYHDNNSLTLNFSAAFSGKAYMS